MAQIYDRVREKARRNVSGGFGSDIFLDGAVIGHTTFADAGVPDGIEVTFVVEDGDDFEIGTANYNASASKLEDVSYRDKSSGSVFPSLSAEAEVFIAARPEDFKITPDLYAETAYNIDDWHVFDDSVAPFQDSLSYGRDSTFRTSYFLSESTRSSFLDLANAKDTYREVNGLTASTNKGVFVSDNGSFLFVMDENDNELQRYRLRTRYNIDTAGGLDQSFSRSDLDSMDARVFAFNPLGNKLLFAGNDSFDNDIRLREYPLNSPFDLSIAGSAQINNVSETLGIPSSTPTSVQYSGDGQKIILVVAGEVFIIRHESSFFNATLESSGLFPFVDIGVGTTDAWFSPDGTRALTTSTDSRVRNATLSTGFDMSTVSYDGDEYNVPGIGGHEYITATSDGSRMYVSDGTGADTREVHLPESFSYGPGLRVLRDGIYKISVSLGWSTDAVSIGDGIFFEVQKSKGSGGEESNNIVDDEARVVSSFGSAVGEEKSIQNVILAELERNDIVYVRATSVGSSEATVDYGSLTVRLIEGLS